MGEKTCPNEAVAMRLAELSAHSGSLVTKRV